MSKKNNYRTKLAQTLAYLHNLLSGKERNRLERTLQKDPFEEEAMEGFQSIDPDEIEKDLLDLNVLLNKRIERKNRMLFFRIAASVAIIITVSVLYFTLFEKEIGDMPGNHPLTERTGEKKDEAEPLSGITDSFPATKSVEAENKKMESKIPIEEIIPSRQTKKDEVVKRPELDIEEIREDRLIVEAEKVPPELSEKEIMADTDLDSQENLRVTEKTEITAESEIAKPFRSPTVSVKKSRQSGSGVIEGKVIYAKDSMPVPGATIVIRGSTTGTMTDSQGRFKLSVENGEPYELIASYIGMENEEVQSDDKENFTIVMEPSYTNLDEVVVMAYGNQEKQDLSDSVSGEELLNNKLRNTYRGAYPEGGNLKFKNYIKENLVFPDTSIETAIVILNFFVSPDGRPFAIEVVQSPGRIFSEEAVRLLEEGPKWLPAQKDGEYIENQNRIRIIFSKSE